MLMYYHVSAQMGIPHTPVAKPNSQNIGKLVSVVIQGLNGIGRLSRHILANGRVGLRCTGFSFSHESRSRFRLGGSLLITGSASTQPEPGPAR
jgi:hypothetical protein